MSKNLSLRVVLSAVDRATGPLRRIMDGSTGTAGAIRQARDQLRDLQGQQKRITAFRDMQRQSVASRDALRDKRESLDRLNSEIAASENPSKRLLQQQERAQREAQKLSDQYSNQRTRVRELARELPPGIDGTRGLTEQNAALERQIRETNERLHAQQDALRRLGDADVGGKFRNMTGEVGRLARRTAMLGTAAAGGIFAIASSTSSLGDNVAKTADKLGIGTTELQELRYAAEQSGVGAGTLDTAMQRMVRRVSEAAQGSGAAKDAIAELGLSAEALASMTPDQQMHRIADAMANVSSQGDRVRLAMKLFDTEGVALVNMLREGAQGLDEYGAAAHNIGYILGEETARGAERFQDNLTDMKLSIAGLKNIIGAELMPVVTELMGRFTTWLAENRDQVRQWAAAFGERLRAAIPVIDSLARGIGTLVTHMSSAINRTAQLVGGFDNLAMIAGGLFAGKAILSIVAFVASLVKAGGALIAFAKTLPAIAGGMKLLGAAFAATPIGWLVAGIMALIYAGYLLWKNWGSLGEQFRGMWEDLKAAFGEGIGAVTKLLLDWSPFGVIYRVIIGALESLGIEVPDQFRTLGGFIVDGLIGGILGGIQYAIDAVTSLGRSIIDGFKNMLGINSPSRVFEGFGSNIVEGIIDGIAGMAGALRDHVVGMASNIANWMKDAVGNAWESGKEIAGNIGQGIADGAQAAGRVAREAGGAALDVGRDVARGIGEGVSNGAITAWNAVKDLAGGAEQVARYEFDTHSPSRVFRDIGGDVATGLGVGIQRNESEPFSQVASMARRLRDMAGGLLLGTAAAAGPAAASQVAVDMPAIDSVALDTRPPMAAGGPSIIMQGDTIEIHVHASPGQSEHELAQQIGRMLEERDRQKAARARSAFYDND